MKRITVLIFFLFLEYVLIHSVNAGLNDDLVAYYPFEGNAYDASGNRNSGTEYGDPIYGKGKYGQAACFDGRNDYINVRRTIGENFTISAWITSSTHSLRGDQCFEGNGIIWSDTWGEGHDFIVGILNDKLCKFTGSPDKSILSVSSLVTGNWMHILSTRNQNSGRVVLYVNGKYENAMLSGRNPLRGNPSIHIGANTLDQRFFQGCIDEIRFYNRVLSESEIYKLYTLDLSQEPLPASSVDEKMRLAVVNFQTLDSVSEQNYLGTMIAEMFTTEVVNSATFKIVEREQLQKVIKELEVGQSGIIDTTEAQEVGKMLGADAIIAGSVMKLGDALRIDARIIEVKTGLIISAEKRICEENIEDISQKVIEMTQGLAKKFYHKQ